MNFQDTVKLAETNDWEAIVREYESRDVNITQAAIYFYVAKAYICLLMPEKALSAVDLGLGINNDNSWGRHLKYEIESELYGTVHAQNELFDYMKEHSNHKTLSSTFINQAVISGDFSRAKIINENRSEINPTIKGGDFAVALQTFCKSDTLEKVLNSLLKCTNSEVFDLYIIQDVPSERHSKEYIEGYESVTRIISLMMNKLIDKFGKVTLVRNKTNLGTAPTCRKVLDIVCSCHKGFLFIEDDCILSHDALVFTAFILETKIDVEGDFWFGSCESVHHNNSEDNAIDIEAEAKRVKENNLVQAVHTVNFVPSTCFISTRDVWDLVKEYRSFPKGPESLNKYVSMAGKKTILPVVARGRDVGMKHELGYSVLNLGLDGVKEKKAHFLDSDRFDTKEEFWFLRYSSSGTNIITNG